MTNYKRYIHWAEWMLAVAAMGYLIYRLVHYKDYDSIYHTIQGVTPVQWAQLVVSFALIPVQLLVETYRWKYVIRGWKDISLKESWSEVLLGQVAGFITPYRAGDLPARLVACGLDISYDEWSIRWHKWLKDWHKWWDVAGYTLARYLVWGIQLWLVLDAVGVHMLLWQGIGSIALYYVMISFMPVLPAAEVALKGGPAVWVFSQYTDDMAVILVAVGIIWIFNTIIPVLFGSLKKILYFCKQK